MRFEELIIQRRSIRKYRDEQVPMELVRDIISDSTMAPSAGNEQPWEFIIVRKREILNLVSDECKKNMLERIAGNPDDYAGKYKNMLGKEAFNIFYHAPTVIFIIGAKDRRNLYVDCALAAAYLMMSATSKKLGTCWVNFAREIHSSALRKELGLTDNHTIVAPVTLGYPEVLPEVPHRKEPVYNRIID